MSLFSGGYFKKVRVCLLLLCVTACAAKPERDPMVPMRPTVTHLSVQPAKGIAVEELNQYHELRGKILNQLSEALQYKQGARDVGLTIELAMVDSEYNLVQALLVGDRMTISGHIVTWDSRTETQISRTAFTSILNNQGILPTAIMRSASDKETRFASDVTDQVMDLLYPQRDDNAQEKEHYHTVKKIAYWPSERGDRISEKLPAVDKGIRLGRQPNSAVLNASDAYEPINRITP